MFKHYIPIITLTFAVLFFLSIAGGLRQYNSKIQVLGLTTPLISGYQPYNTSLNLSSFYTQNTGVSTVNKPKFGIYDFAFYNNQLYVGINDDLPAGGGPASIAVLTPNSIQHVHTLLEEGIFNSKVYNNKLYYPGIDPIPVVRPGSVGVYDGSMFTQHQTGLDNVIHLFDIEMGPDNNLYSSSGSWAGTPACLTINDCWGGVLKSVDGGVTWQEVYRHNTLRTNDLIFQGNTLYAMNMGNTYWDARSLYKSLDYGKTWSAVVTGETLSPINMVKHKGNIIVFDGSTLQPPNKLYSINPQGQITPIQLPFNVFLEHVISNNIPAIVTPDDYLYIFTENRTIVRSQDLINWQTVVNLATTDIPTTMFHLASQNYLIFSTKGDNANVYYIPLTQISSPTPTPMGYTITINPSAIGNSTGFSVYTALNDDRTQDLARNTCRSTTVPCAIYGLKPTDHIWIQPINNSGVTVPITIQNCAGATSAGCYIGSINTSKIVSVIFDNSASVTPVPTSTPYWLPMPTPSPLVSAFPTLQPLSPTPLPTSTPIPPTPTTVVPTATPTVLTPTPTVAVATPTPSSTLGVSVSSLSCWWNGKACATSKPTKNTWFGLVASMKNVSTQTTNFTLRITYDNKKANFSSGRMYSGDTRCTLTSGATTIGPWKSNRAGNATPTITGSGTTTYATFSNLSLSGTCTTKNINIDGQSLIDSTGTNQLKLETLNTSGTVVDTDVTNF